MTEGKALSFADLRQESCTGKTFKEVPAYGGVVTIGTLSSAFMIEWLEDNDDPVKKRRAGLRLLVRSLVDPTTKEPAPPEQLDELLEVFSRKDSRENSKVIAAALELNGLRAKGQTTTTITPEDERKNGSSEAPTDASRTDSPSPQVD